MAVITGCPRSRSARQIAQQQLRPRTSQRVKYTNVLQTRQWQRCSSCCRAARGGDAGDAGGAPPPGASGGDPGAAAGDAGDALLARALDEAVNLAKRAQALAQDQARAELQQGWLAAGGGGGSDGESAQGGRPEPLLAFLEEQGLSRRQAEAVLAALPPAAGGAASAGPRPGSGAAGGAGGGASSEPAALSRAQLEARWHLLQRVLAGADVPAMVASEPTLLAARPNALVGALVALVAAFPAADVADLVQRRPGLLLLEDLGERCERVIAKLLQLHPSESRGIVSALITEYPSLLVRMDYYADARSLDDLPIEMQNWMVPGGQAGIAWLYRYWGQKKRQRQQQELEERQQGRGQGGGGGSSASSASGG
ncbi:MAG: hypothetical protein J3K34DRAFT_267661 [Monoraphidium minutum]|nr:MAG: hypothetical protein J3K34DRAFT_267661 [Monoraphidium minutum]